MTNTTAKEAEVLSYQGLKDLLEKKKEAEIDKVTKELTAAKGIVAALEAQLVNLGVTQAAPPLPTGKKRGRPAKHLNGNGATKPIKLKKSKRGEVGAAITKYVERAGKTGAHVKDIAKGTDSKPANITAFFYAKANKTKFKKVAPGTFALK